MQTKQSKDYYSLKDSAELLNISVNQLNYLISKEKIQPSLRVGSKHSNVLYSKEQLRDLKLSISLKRYKLSENVELKIIELARNSNYNQKIWAITFEDIIQETQICLDDDLLTLTREISKLNTAISIKPIFEPI